MVVHLLNYVIKFIALISIIFVSVTYFTAFSVYWEWK